ncbi:hypothetical protein IJ531_03610 [bacterium]|nr:hypothetical protein [bacterium]
MFQAIGNFFKNLFGIGKNEQVQDTTPVVQEETGELIPSTEAKDQTSIFSNDEASNKASYTISQNGKYDLIEAQTRAAKMNGQSMTEFIERQYGTNLDEGEQYAAMKEVVDANRSRLIEPINEQYLITQVIGDLGDITDNENHMSMVHTVVDALLENPDVDIENLHQWSDNGNDIVASWKDLTPASQEALKNVQEKLKNNEYDQFDIDVNVDKIPPEVIKYANYQGVVQALRCPTISTLQKDTDTDTDKITTDIGFSAETGKRNDLGQSVLDVDVNGKDADEAREYIEKIIAQSYGLVDEFGNPLTLDSQAGSAIVDAIARDENNNQYFDGGNNFFDIGKSGVDEVVNRLYLEAMRNGGTIDFVCPDVDISIQGEELTVDDARAQLIKENGEVQFTQLHVLQDSVSIENDNINKGIDILEYVEYQGQPLKQVLQETIAQSFNDTVYAELTYDQAIELAKTNKDAEAYNNLILLQGSEFANTPKNDPNFTLGDAIKGILDNEYPTVNYIKTLAATAVKQELGNNHAIYDDSSFMAKYTNTDDI